MKPSQVAQSLNHLVEKRRPAFLWGPPGVGKSDVVAQVARQRNSELRDVRLSLLDPVDLKGFPIADQATKMMSWLPPDFLPPAKTKTPGILFLDELVSAPPAVQAAAYQLILDHRIGNYVLPANWSIVAAGNREADRAVVHRMPSALANRLVHIDFEIHLDDWVDWAISNDMHPDIIAFLRFRSDLLHKFDPKDNPRSFPSPRSWMFVNDLYKSRLPSDLEFSLIEGTVGDGAAAEFIAFVRVIRDLPTIEEVLAKPDKITVPTEPSVLYALTTTLGIRLDHKDFDKACKFVERMPIEFQAVFMRTRCKREAQTAQHKSFVNWAMKHGGIFASS